ncbi:MAG: SAM-dependent methyltransferase [Crocinitomicaceae bacterium]|nr:SAM-dependent methyltransferase [Crocinitomicaceae bacterium]|tara:strand:- start:20200 stop:20970 length:771 start_codon:yes stop_codon:yes gene_type:complete
MNKKIQTAERVSHQERSDNYVFQRSILAYYETAKLISGNVLEIGTGSGYGIEVLSPNVDSFLTIDKFPSITGLKLSKEIKNVDFRQMTVPPLENIPDNYFDFVVSFQVIEHINSDIEFVKEIYRVLKKKGKFILTTPNKKMSLTRNPWHVREYTIEELRKILLGCFSIVNAQGVFGNNNVMNYYQENKKSVQKIKRFDLFNLEYNLPRWLFQIPYDILNRMNRKKLSNKGVDIKMTDYYLASAQDDCIDLFYIAEK